MLFLIFILNLVASRAGAESFDRFEETVHILKVKSEANSADMVRGTGFVVDKEGGLLITNYHVISGIFRDGKVDARSRVFAYIGKKDYLASVLKIDILKDLALIHVPFVFKDQVHIRETPLSKGEKIYSLGFHDKEFMAINQGTFNDYLSDSQNQLMAISCPLNPGMSGGPILDASLEVVGMNVLKSGKESDGYGVNAKHIVEFLGTAKQLEPLSLDKILVVQIQKTYQLIQSALESAHEYHPLNGWSVLSLDPIMECGEFRTDHNPNEDTEDADKNGISITTRECELDPRKVPLSVLGGEMRFAYSIANIRGGVNTRTLTYYNYLNDTFKFQGFKSLILLNEEYNCQREVIENKHAVKFKMSICAFKLKSLPSFIKEKQHYRYEVNMITMTPRLDNLVLSAQFSGSKEVAKKVIKKLIGGISLEKAGG